MTIEGSLTISCGFTGIDSLSQTHAHAINNQNTQYSGYFYMMWAGFIDLDLLM